MSDLVERLRLPGGTSKCPTHAPHDHDQHIADAQLTRAAWGLVDWLYQEAAGWTRVAGAARGVAVLWQAEELERKLRAAGIPRPQEEKP